MKLPTLYKYSNSKKLISWTMEVEGSKYRSIYSQGDGKITTSSWSTASSNSLRTGEEQAIGEAESLWRKKRRLGMSISKIRSNEKILEVTLAHKYKDFSDRIKWKLGIGVQSKKNGNRCTAQLINGKVTLMSRGQKEWTACPHISNSLVRFFEIYPEAVLDGELYNHHLRQKLNELSSIIKKKKPTPEQLKRSEEIVQYHVYDGYGFGPSLGEDAPYFYRKAWIDQTLPSFSPYYREVPTTLCHSVEEMEVVYQAELNDGGEGVIMRNMNSEYVHGRTSNLLKHKPEMDSEGIIDGIESGDGNWFGCAKGVWIIWEGKRFKGTFKGDQETCRDILNNQDKWIGKKVTFLYSDLTGLGTPNFARIDTKNCISADR